MLLLLVLAGAAMRLYFRDLPNFAPVAGLALFAGFLFSNRALAMAAPIGVMLVTDQFLGGYQPLLMLTVYSMLTLPILMRTWIRTAVDRATQERSIRSVGSVAVGLLASSLFCSLAFFFATNLATWLVTPWYPRTMDGLLSCFANALPFFRYTLSGDLASMAFFFGGYAVWSLARAEKKSATAVA